MNEPLSSDYLLGSPLKSFMGFKIITSPYIPDTVPAVQMHPDCDPQGLWCTPEFRAETDRWLLEKLGTKEVAFIMTDQQMIAVSTRMRERIDRDIEKLFMGRGL